MHLDEIGNFVNEALSAEDDEPSRVSNCKNEKERGGMMPLNLERGRGSSSLSIAKSN